MSTTQLPPFSTKALAAPALFFPQYDNPPRYDFDQGMPDPSTYPLEALQACADQVIKTQGQAACGYFGLAGRSEMIYGYAGLRDSIASWVGKRDKLSLDRKNIMLMNGSAAGLSMIANALVGPGDGAIVESTTFPYMASFLESTGATVFRAAVDSEGLVVEDAERCLREMKGQGLVPKLIYTIPTFHVPTGVLMPLARRQQLLDLARCWNVYVVEDNCYNELWYDQPTPPTLLSLEPGGRVIQSDSFSKMLAPGLRTGWVVASPEVASMIGRMRPDLGVSQFTSHVVNAWMANGRLDEHLNRVRPLYRRKRDIAADALRRHCGAFVKFHVPQGGIFFWLELAPGIDGQKVRETLLREGVACRPGERFAGATAENGYLRMSFLQVDEDEIERGVALLGQAFAAAST
ncbi:PLP-dependent aminotransferase family protein [Hydrogenophaga sp.]|uniref:aminotransferase-like domain-containing protein n=1 Tax=Hydrogenophaga sp. TaxID=1904254 RepID=UPI00271A3EBC|nr:PLP-dependent aminotransferase family protein [Hydrogenophaga sp.]MDO9435366.1 PLP-dependent aminotransferase family protein [Hydrogenophaga sp.]